ncbi:MAG: inorganic diphosphatase [Candidatus Shapirobacteria bacterium]|nr:inorganic diphosphatase [Candidatus Shapirobacteria bacterium]
MDSKSLILAKSFLNQIIEVVIDKQLGCIYSEYKTLFEVNYGFIPDTIAPDGKELDAYVLKVDKPLEKFTGRVVAVIHRLDDDDDKLVVIPDVETITDEEINKLTNFQEQFFKHEIVR